MDGGAEGVQHLHLLQHVLPAGGADDEQLPTLQEEHVTRFILCWLKGKPLRTPAKLYYLPKQKNTDRKKKKTSREKWTAHDSRRPGTTQDKETRDDEGFVVTRLAAGALWPLAGLSSAAPAEPEAPGWRSEVRWGRSPAGARCRPPPRSWAATYMRHQRPGTEGGWRERDEWSKEKQMGRMQEGINELKSKMRSQQWKRRSS